MSRREADRVIDVAGPDLVVVDQPRQDRQTRGVGGGPAGRPQPVRAAGSRSHPSRRSIGCPADSARRRARTGQHVAGSTISAWRSPAASSPPSIGVAPRTDTGRGRSHRRIGSEAARTSGVARVTCHGIPYGLAAAAGSVVGVQIGRPRVHVREPGRGVAVDRQTGDRCVPDVVRRECRAGRARKRRTDSSLRARRRPRRRALPSARGRCSRRRPLPGTRGRCSRRRPLPGTRGRHPDRGDDRQQNRNPRSGQGWSRRRRAHQSTFPWWCTYGVIAARASAIRLRRSAPRHRICAVKRST